MGVLKETQRKKIKENKNKIKIKIKTCKSSYVQKTVFLHYSYMKEKKIK